MFKRILRSAWFQATLATLLAGYMALIKRTTRWSHIGREHVEPIWEGGEGLILCVWHGRFLVAHSVWPKDAQPPAVLSSESNDGDFMAAAVQRLGLGCIRGSTRREGSDKDRGGMRAFKKMVRYVKSKGCIVITPDGPRGPHMRCGEGPIRLAKITGAPLLPYGLAVSNRKMIKSWDSFMFPFPFGRGVFVFGEPVYIARSADEAGIEAARLLFEQRMIDVQIQADTYIGKEIIQPSEITQKVNASQEEPAA